MNSPKESMSPYEEQLVALKKRELDIREKEIVTSNSNSYLKSPLFVAVIGGILAIFAQTTSSIIQTNKAQDQLVTKYYLDTATEVLKDVDSNKGLRLWAADVINKFSAIPLDQNTQEELVLKGTTDKS